MNYLLFFTCPAGQKTYYQCGDGYPITTTVLENAALLSKDTALEKQRLANQYSIAQWQVLSYKKLKQQLETEAV